MRKFKPFPNRFLRLEIQDRSAGEQSNFSFFSSGNMHPYINPSASAYLPEELKSKVKPRVDFDVVYDISQVFNSAQIRIFNLKRMENDFLQLSKDARIKLEAGYNGHILNQIFDGFITGEPFTSNDFPNNYTLIQAGSSKNLYKTEKQINVHLESGGVKRLIANTESNFGVKIKLPDSPNIKILLNKGLDISIKGNLEQMIDVIKGLLGVDIVNTAEDLFECFDNDGKKLMEGKPTGIKIHENNIIKFEFLFKEKENLKKAEVKPDGDTIFTLANKEFFNKAESKPVVLTDTNKKFFAQDIPLIPKRLYRQIDAKLSLFMQGGLSLGQLLSITLKGVEQLFFIKSISFNGSSYGTGTDFKTDLELYIVKDA